MEKNSLQLATGGGGQLSSPTYKEGYVALKDMQGHIFYMPGTPLDEVSILEGGYIITPHGAMVVVKDHVAHSDIFSTYIKHYQRTPNEYFNTIRGGQHLVKLNHIVYLGTKISDISMIGGLSQFNLGGTLRSDSTFFLNETPTEQQKEAFLKLISTNRSIFDPSRKKIDSTYGNPLTGEEYSEEKVLTMMSLSRTR